MPDSSDNVNSGTRASAVTWGPVIRVNNEKPYGLVKDKTPVWWTDGEAENVSTTERLVWKQDGLPLCAIRLPADHPHYSKAPTTPEIDPALWDRMVALVRDMADREIDGCDPRIESLFIKADNIFHDLPKPVDPDLIEAREIAASMLEVAQGGAHIEETRRGERDGYVYVCIALAGIQRGRQLAAPEVSHVG